MKHTAYLSLGTNIGNKRQNLLEAIERIGKSVGAVVRQSTFLETEPWGFDSDNMFVNAAICVETELCPLCLLRETQRIEFEMGRTEKYDNGNGNDNGNGSRSYKDRIIDIDILLYDDITLDLPELKIPHPLMREREFVMKPLSEILLSQT